jgi:predicted dehydrogenase
MSVSPPPFRSDLLTFGSATLMHSATSPISIAVIGTSWWADTMYLPAIVNHPLANVVALCGRNLDRASELADVWQIPAAFDDYEHMLRDLALDAVIVTTSNASHYSISLAALDAGLNVLCEKPLGLNLEEAEALSARAKELGAITMVPFTYRFMPTNRYIKQLIDDGFVGRPYHLNLRYYTGFARDGDYRWRFDRGRAGSGVLGDIGSHFLYLATWWFGPVATVYCQSSSLVARPPLDPEGHPYELAEDTALVTLTFANGAVGSLHISAVAAEETSFGQLHACEVHGSGGTLHSIIDWDRKQEVWGARAGEGVPQLLEIPETIWQGVRCDTVHNTYRDVFRTKEHMARAFVTAVATGQPASPDFADGAYIQRLVDAAVESDRTKQRIEIAHPSV